MQAAPVLLGYVTTQAKPTSEVILVTETGDPLLAWWRYGLGMSLAFTSDASTRWAAEWTTWSDFPVFWAQCVRHVLRNDAQAGADIQLRRRGDQTTVQVDLQDADGEFRSAADVRLKVLTPPPESESIDLVLPQTAPGRYAAQIATGQQGAYFLELAVQEGANPPQRQSRSLCVGYPDELQWKPTNVALLRQIANVSGGRFDPRPAEVFQPLRSAVQIQPLWPYLLSAALLLLLLDVALRRVELGGTGRNNEVE